MWRSIWEGTGWEAIAAVGTVGTLWYAVHLGGQAARDSRRREAATLKRVIIPLQTLADAIGNCLDEVATTSSISAWREDWINTFERYDRMLADIGFDAMPSSQSMNYFLGSRGVVDNLIGLLRELAPVANTPDQWVLDELVRRRVQLQRNVDGLAREVLELGEGGTQRDHPLISNLLYRVSRPGATGVNLDIAKEGRIPSKVVRPRHPN